MEHPDTKSIPFGKIFPSGLVAKFAFAFLVCCLLFTNEAHATHFRYGSITWVKGNGNTVTFKVSQAYRRSFYTPTPNLGSVVNTETLVFGDGTTAAINLTVTSVNITEDWFYGEATISHTYPSAGPFTAYFTNGNRLSTLVNNADFVFRVESSVNLNNNNNSPVSTLPVIVNVATNLAAAVINVPSADGDGDALTFSFSNATQMGAAGSTQPAGLTWFNTSTGVLNFNTIGKAIGSLYNASVRISDGKGGITTVDFIIRIVGGNNPPYYDYSITPANGFVYNIQPGQTLTFTVKAQDNDNGDIVVINATGVPIGGSHTPVLPTNPGGNPIQTTFTWTPTVNQLGVVVITYTATDQTGQQAITSVTIIVSTNPVFDSPPTIANGSDVCVPTNQLFNTTIQAHTPVPQGTVRITSATTLTGVSYSPVIPTPALNTTSTVLGWTPTPSQWGPHAFSFTATDNFGNTQNHGFTLIVNTAPAFTSTPPTLVLSENQPFSYNITVNDPDLGFGDALNILGLTLPSWLTLTPTGPNTATLSGTPGHSDLGINSVLLGAEDIYHHCYGQVTQLFDLDVEPCTLSVTIDAQPSQEFNYCPGESVTLTATQGDSYSWSTGATTQNITVIAGAFTQYSVTVTSGFCTGEASHSIEGLDDEAPTAVCNLNVNNVVLDANGQGSLSVNDVDGGSTDNCGIQSITIAPANFDCSDLGANTVVLTVTDNSGLTATCTTSVNVVDNIAPTAACKNVTLVLGSNGEVILSPGDIDNGSSDNCGTPSLSVSQASFDCSDIGTHLVTLTVTDASGNSSSCTAAVTILDREVPVVSCQNARLVLDANGEAVLDPASLDAGTVDNCTILNLNASQILFDCADLGNNNVTLIATDGSGNSATCPAVVEVVDEDAPNAICQNATLQLNANGTATLTVAMIDNGSTDNCSIVSRVLSKTLFTCADLGANQVTLTLTDQSGNVSSCNATVTVADQVAPVAKCKTAVIVLDANGDATLSVADVNNASTDNCNLQSLVLSQTSFDCSYINGPTQVTLTATDGSGNTNSCTANVFVMDEDAPTALCKNATLHLDANGNAEATLADIDNGSTDNCGIVFSGLSGTQFSCENVGANTVTLTVQDATGNEGQCLATVTVVDDLAPTALCKSITVQLDGNGTATISANDIDNGSFDNCGVDGISVQPSTFTCANIGDNQVTLTVTDVNGNSATCTATVTVEDDVAPSITCKNITIQLDANGNATIDPADLLDGLPGGNCGTPSLSVSQSSFDCSDLGANTVTLTATDGSGNTSSCTATVTVEDNEAPTANCQSITIQLDANGNATIDASDLNLGSTDNCGVTGFSASQTSFDCENLGTNTVTLTVTDASGNSSTCTATVTVEDNLAPSVTCKNATVFLDANGDASLSTGDILNSASDNCGQPSLTTSESSFTCDDLGENSVTLTATDASGNSASCTTLVRVVDALNPVAMCKNATVALVNGQASIVPADVDNGSTDNCSIVSWTVNPNTFNCDNIGANTVTLTVTDQSGNSASCQAIVTIVDETDPTAVCRDITVTLVNGTVTITAADIDGGSIDGCGNVTLGASQYTFTTANVGTNTVILTVTDESGNVSTCTATVTVLNPAITCNASANRNTIYLGFGPQTATLDVAPASGDAPFTYGWTPSASLSCSNCQNPVFTASVVGTFTFTASVVDANGSGTTCDVVICVFDPARPEGTPDHGAPTYRYSPHKVYVCHIPPGNPDNPITIWIDWSGVPAHVGLHGGDHIGTCNQVCSSNKDGESEEEEIPQLFGNEELGFEVLLYPNPFGNEFHITVESHNLTETVDIRLFDVAGKLVGMRQGVNPNEDITLGQGIAAGAYVVEVQQGTDKQIIKVIKTK